MTIARNKAGKAEMAVGGHAFVRECLGLLARILVRTGHSPERLVSEMRDVCGELKESSKHWDPTRLAYTADLPHILAHWHTSPKYTDAQGRPLPLPPKAQGPCLTALIAQVLPGEDPSAVIGSLTRLKAVSRRGKAYVPRVREIIFTDDQDSGLLHALTILLGMLRTVDYNTRGGEPRLLERTAINPNYPVSRLPALHRFLKRRAGGITRNLDDRMGRDEAGVKGGDRARVGVAFFMFQDPFPSDIAITRTSRERLPRTTTQRKRRVRSR
jgi:hypothetical protein